MDITAFEKPQNPVNIVLKSWIHNKWFTGYDFTLQLHSYQLAHTICKSIDTTLHLCQVYTLTYTYRSTQHVIPLFITSSLVPPVLFSFDHCYTRRTSLEAPGTSSCKHLFKERGDHSGYGLGQWEKTLHWLIPYPEWSLETSQYIAP